MLGKNIRELGTITNKLDLHRVHATCASVLRYQYGKRTGAVTVKKLDSHKKM